jgi:hypothetical protein
LGDPWKLHSRWPRATLSERKLALGASAGVKFSGFLADDKNPEAFG